MTQSKIVQTTGDHHHQVTDLVLPVAHFVFYDPAALHTGHRVLDPHFLTGDAVVLGFLRVGEGPTTWFLRRLLHRDTGNGKALEPPVLVQDTASG